MIGSEGLAGNAPSLSRPGPSWWVESFHSIYSTESLGELSGRRWVSRGPEPSLWLGASSSFQVFLPAQQQGKVWFSSFLRRGQQPLVLVTLASQIWPLSGSCALGTLCLLPSGRPAGIHRL